MYMPPGKKRPDTIKELKTKEVTALAWINNNRIILGTADGDIWSANIEDSVGFFGSITTTKHYSIPNESISGLVTCSLNPSVDQSKTKRIILAATKQKLIHFIGPEISSEINLDKIFSNGSTGSNVISFKTETNFESKLILSPIPSENGTRVFAWTCMDNGHAVMVGEIQANADRNRPLTSTKIITGHGQVNSASMVI